MLAFGTLVTLLQRVGGPQGAGSRAPVEVWGWNLAAESLDHLAPDFERANPGIDLQVKVSGAMVQTRLLLSLTGGVGEPGICQLQEREAPKYTTTGRLADMKQWASKYEAQFPVSSWASCVVDGGIYAIPWDIGPCAVFYKRWIFEKYNLDPRDIETWDDFIAMGEKLATRSQGRVRMMPLAISALGDLFQILMQQNGGGIFDQQGRIIINNPENREALRVLRKLLESGICAPLNVNSDECIASYGTDSIAAYPGAVWLMHNIKDKAASRAGQWGVFRLPAIRRGGLRASNLGGSVLVVPSQGNAVAEAQRFVEYALCTTDSQVTQYQQYGLFPAYLPAHKDPRFDQPDAFFGGQRVAALFAEDYAHLQPMYRTRNWAEAERYLGETLSVWASLRQDNTVHLRSVAETLSTRLNCKIALPMGSIP